MKERNCEVVSSAYLESLQARVSGSLEEATDDASHAGHDLEMIAMVVEVSSISTVTNLTE